MSLLSPMVHNFSYRPKSPGSNYPHGPLITHIHVSHGVND
jgi:hypothetical protein